MGFSAWGPGDPNNLGENGESENCVHLYHYSSSTYDGGAWNDYICMARKMQWSTVPLYPLCQYF